MKGDLCRFFPMHTFVRDQPSHKATAWQAAQMNRRTPVPPTEGSLFLGEGFVGVEEGEGGGGEGGGDDHVAAVVGSFAD